MIIIPAIDILGGQVVRLSQGNYDRSTVYHSQPPTVAQRWHAEGAELLHVVDLEGARSGVHQQLAIEALVQAGARLQFGGGVRGARTAQRLVRSGVERIVVGTAVTSQDGQLDQIVDQVGPDAVVAALDVRDGRAVGSGWIDTGVPLDEAVGRLSSAGVVRALVTGIDRDGTMEGPDVALLDQVRQLAPRLAIIASGGVGSLEDLATLAVSTAQVEAVIVGRALYEGRFSLTEAIAVTGP